MTDFPACYGGCSDQLLPRQLKKRIDLFNIRLVKGADRRLQLELSKQRVKTRLGQISTRRVKLLFRIQHIDVDSHADFVAQFVGLKGGLGRG